MSSELFTYAHVLPIFHWTVVAATQENDGRIGCCLAIVTIDTTRAPS